MKKIKLFRIKNTSWFMCESEDSELNINILLKSTESLISTKMHSIYFTSNWMRAIQIDKTNESDFDYYIKEFNKLKSIYKCGNVFELEICQIEIPFEVNVI